MRKEEGSTVKNSEEKTIEAAVRGSDLVRSTRRVYLSPPHMGEDERQLLLDAFDSNWIAPLGPHVDAFEQEFAETVGVENAVALSSGSAALHLALVLSGVGPGDDVLTSTFTFAASAFAIRYVGARPVFIDSSADTWNLDPALLAEELEERARQGRLPKAALVVDICGQCADYDPILDACARFDVPVIEDAAEALGATYKDRSAGTFGRFGAFSFNGNKIITTSGGGMLVCPTRELAEKARFLSTQARDAAPHYQHSQLGYNYRLSNLLAAVGRGQLRQLENRVAVRRSLNAYYRKALAGVPGVSFMPEAPYGRATCWLTSILVDSTQFGAGRADVQRRLEELNIESRPVWKPMHQQPIFADCSRRGGAVADQLFERGLSLPSGSSLSAAERELVVRGLLEVGRRS
jgi:dTDP-4-amino-4,6-dideoxygalactose transaminase